ncbi:MAG: NADH:flavin oxidoreductase [Dehalococcoidales bacterium]
MAELFEPVTIGSLELKNRVVRSATWDGAADPSGAVTDDSVALFRELGRGNIGLIVTGHAFVSLLGQATSAQYGVHTDEMIPGLKRLVEAVHQGGAKIAIQITHSGINSGYLRQQGIALQVVSPRNGLKALQQEMTDGDIEALIDDFVLATQRAIEAGFDIVQLHGAHGYMMSQFLSPLSNQRTDRWGGSDANRRRFHLEMIKKIRQVIGRDFPLMIKFGVMEDREGGLSLSESVKTAQEMVEQGIDALEISSGGSRGSIPRLAEDGSEQVVFRDRAAAVKKAVNVPVILVGGIRSLPMATKILHSGDVDLIAMCRPFIREPDLMVRWQRGEVEPATCISCNKCMPGERVLSCGEDRRIREEASAVS